MSMQVSNGSWSHEILNFVMDGIYPENKYVEASSISSTAVSSLSELLAKATEEVKASVRVLSRLSSPDIDGWIQETKRLRDDIDETDPQSANIVALAEQTRETRIKARDMQDKLSLLTKEVVFNEELYKTLEEVRNIKHTVGAAQKATISAKLETGAQLLHKSTVLYSKLHERANIQLKSLIEAKMVDVKNALIEAASRHWKCLVEVDLATMKLTVRKCNEDISLVGLVDVLKLIDCLDLRIDELKEALTSSLMLSLLRAQPDKQIPSLSIDANSITVSQLKVTYSTEQLLNDLRAWLEFLKTRFPQALIVPLMEIFVPSLVTSLIANPLSGCVPQDLSDLSHFEYSLVRAREFSEFLEKNRWPGVTELCYWIDNAPKTWLARRTESALHSIRQLLLRGIGEPRSVERVETRVVEPEDAVFNRDTGKDNWYALASDGYKRKGSAQTSNESEADTSNGLALDENAEDDDGGDEGNAWGWDEDEDEGPKHKNDGNRGQSDNAEDAWDWGDDDDAGDDDNDAYDKKENERIVIEAPSKAIEKNDRRMLEHNDNIASQREVTLKESYFITALPEQVLEIIIQAVDDASFLGNPENSNHLLVVNASDLLELPTLLLSMYRASAANIYSENIRGNMYLYNDCLYLAEQLERFIQHRESRDLGGNGLENAGLITEITTLVSFGKGSYRREMESQRTIIGDLLDNAQEFRNCTDSPFAEQCDNAIKSTIDRLETIHEQFKEVLSPSATLQSIGSLLSSVISKIIVDIEDMSDMTEPESRKLASICRQIEGLQDLFLPDNADTKERQPAATVAFYTPNWWKFCYLAEVLESSLADIKYLWSEGELSLEFEVDEIIDLIQALFAESEHRRSAITEIRRASGGPKT